MALKQKQKKDGSKKLITSTRLSISWLPLAKEHQGMFSPKQAAFIVAYSKCMNATKACLEVYNTTKENASSVSFDVMQPPYMRAAVKLIQDRYLESIEPSDIIQQINEQYDKNAFQMRKKRKLVTTTQVMPEGKQGQGKDGEVSYVQETIEEIDTNPQALSALQMKLKLYDNIMTARSRANMHTSEGSNQTLVVVNNNLFEP